MEHNNNNPKDEIDDLLYDYFKNNDEDVPIETSKAIDEALYKKKKHSSFNISKIVLSSPVPCCVPSYDNPT